MDDSVHGRNYPIDLTGIQIQLSKEQLERIEARQVSSEESFVEACEEAFNPWAADKDKREKFRPLEQRTSQVRAAQAAKLLSVDSAQEMAESFQRENPELEPRTLLTLLKSLNPSDSEGAILQKVLAFYPDPYLADEALRFLAEVTVGEQQGSIRRAREEHRKKRGRQIVAGKNISAQAREYAEKGVGTPSSLRELYQETTHNSTKEPLELFEQFSGKYSYDKLHSVFQFLFHSLGGDLNSKGPSIEPGELHQLITEVRVLQAILGVYRFFEGRMTLIQGYFSRHELKVPDRMTFETLARQFVKMAMDRYPTSSKVLQLTKQFHLEDEIAAKILVLMQMRDAIRGLSPRLYKTDKHKNELFLAIVEALDELEELVEEEGDEKEEKDDDNS